MNQVTSILSLWEWTPTLGLVLLLLLAWGLWLGKNHQLKAMHWMCLGLAFLFSLLALASPLAVLAGSYLFSAHMLQHIFLLMVIPPLLWLSIPEQKTAPPTWMNKFKMPIWSWLAGVGLMWLLHFPWLFKEVIFPLGSLGWCSSGAAGSGSVLHALHPVATLLVGLWFALPILTPWKGLRLSPLKGIAFLVSACTACSVLGILITFAPIGTYPGFGLQPDLFGIQHFLQTNWGLSPQTDQQVGGLLMWVPGCFIYLSGSLYLLGKWFNEPETHNPLMATQS